MSLSFVDFSSDRVTIAANASHNTLSNWTSWQWVYPTSNTNGSRFFQKANAGGTEQFTFNWSGSGRSLTYRRRATTDSLQFTDDFTTNAWQFAAVTFDASAGQGLRMYRGTLTSTVVECTYVGANQNGSGAVATADGPLTVGNRVAADRAFGGRQANFGYINRTLTLGEIRALQFAPQVVNGTVIYHQYFNASSAPDWCSSANTGTVVGATVAAHVPMRPMFGR